ncbi:MAG: PAS domain S-box protein [Melioribacteraceae bacterium]|nr:PAS domain S-box protein [Melioribacteraceae bacterium]
MAYLRRHPFIQYAFLIATIYFIFGSLWILLTDSFVESLNLSSSAYTSISIIKGWFFVLSSTLLIYLLIRRFENKVTTKNSQLESEISERKATLELLKESENYNRLLFNKSPIGLALCKMDGKLVDVNDSFANIIGRSIDETLNLTYWDLTPKSYIEKELMLLEKLKSDGFYGPYEKEYKHKNGSLINVILRGLIIERNGEKYIWSAAEDITSRKLADEKLKETETRYRSFFDLSRDGIIIFSEDKKILSINNELIRISQYSEKEAMNFSFSILFPDEDSAISSIRIKKLINGEDVFPFEATLVSKSGIQIPVEISVNLMRNLYNLDYVFQANIRDIAERKKAEQELFHNKQLLQDIIDFSPVVIYVFDIEGKCNHVNKKFLSLFKNGETEFIGKKRDEFMFPSIADQNRKNDIAVIESKKTLSFEEENIESDGVHYYLTEKFPLIDSQGNVYAVGSVSNDITVRIKAESEIKYLNNRLYLLINSIKELSSAHTLDEVQKIVSISARKLTGADGATIVLRKGEYCYYADEDSIEPLWKGKSFPINSCICGWAMLNKQHAIINDIYFDDRILVEMYKPTYVKSLAIVPVNIIEPIAAIGIYWSQNYTPNQREIQLLQTLADAASIAIQNVNLLDELEVRVSLRTAELENANKELESFSYSVSHDLRAPLRHISGYVELLSKKFNELLPDKGKEYLSNIADSTHQMNELINNLLEFSRTGRIEIKKTEFNMKKLLEEAFQIFQEQITERKISLIVEELPSVFADRSLIKLVWINFLSNAIKFTRNNSTTTIEIGYYNEKDYIVFYIKDNGVGFDMRYSEKLFGVFQRLHSTEEFEGNGIGLANIQRIIHKHLGKIWAEGELGIGAAFYFSLPIKKD